MGRDGQVRFPGLSTLPRSCAVACAVHTSLIGLHYGVHCPGLLQAMINYALNETGQSTLTYIGHSQGTIQAFSGLSINPVISSKVNLFVALAPVAYVNNQKSLLLTLMADLDVVALFQLFGKPTEPLQLLFVWSLLLSSSSSLLLLLLLLLLILLPAWCRS